MDQMNIVVTVLERKYLAGSPEEIRVIKQKCSGVLSDNL